MKILDILQDVLLRILYELEVTDILCLERTCTYLQHFIAFDARHLWLVKLNELDQACAPDLLPYIDVDVLTCAQLREIVIRAMRVYCSMVKGPLTTAAYTPIRTIIPARPERLSDEQHYRIHSVKIAPGGRFLFMRCTAADYNELRILDLENGDRCIWSLDIVTVHEELKNDHRDGLVHYDFDICQDCSITLALSMQVRTRGAPEDETVIKSFFKVLRLVPNSAYIISMQETTATTFEIEDPDAWYSTCAVSGKFAVFGVRDNLLIAMNWEENQMGRYQRSVVENGPRHPQVWRDHLFYVDYKSDATWLCAFSLIQALTLSSSSSSEALEFRDLDISYFRLAVHKVDGSPSPILRDVRYSLYDYPWKLDSKIATVSTIARTTESPGPHTASRRAIFNPCQSSADKWTLISNTRPIQYPSADNIPWLSIQLESELSRSGRLLVTLGKQRIDHGMVAVNRQGDLIFPRFSRNIASIPVHKLYNGEDPEDKADILEEYIEPYSGMLVALRDKGSGKDSIELFYPD